MLERPAYQATYKLLQTQDWLTDELRRKSASLFAELFCTQIELAGGVTNLVQLAIRVGRPTEDVVSETMESALQLFCAGLAVGQGRSDVFDVKGDDND